MTNIRICDVVNRLRLGDKVQINDFENIMAVKGLSDNYILLSDGDEYTIVQKFPEEYLRNGIPAGSYVCATDDRLFGVYIGGFEKQYDFDNAEWVNAYLSLIESGDVGLSFRHREEITGIYLA